jgi:putative salt-induced outer membrane protein YdiY
MRIHTWLRAVAAFLALLAMGPAIAADTLIMRNGDRITGTISKIWDGEVYIEPPYADVIKVGLKEVKLIDARRDFEFETRKGEKFTGQLGVDPQGNQVLVRDGGETPLDLAEVAELEEPEAPFEWNARADVNGNNSTGNSETTNLLVQAHGMVRFGDHRHEGDVRYDYQETDSERVSDRLALRYDYNWLFDEHWFLGALAGYERDPVRELDGRVTVGGAVGYEFFDDADRYLRVYLGPSFVHEELGGETTDTAAGLWRLDFRHKVYRDKVEFFHWHRFLAYATGTRNRVFNSSTGFRMDVTDDIYTNLQFDYDHETKPAAGRNGTDTRFLLGLGVKLE